MVKIHGALVDEHTRCIHYRTALDIVAINFKCCDRYYACHLCHAESESHHASRWEMTDLRQPAVICGNCRDVLEIGQYLSCDFACPTCGSQFNPGCASHYDLYFNLAP
jgi:uncharacterized CHY-type Zn-finger protein